MGCGSQAGGRQVEIPKEFTIHGHVLDNSSRSLKMACLYAGKTFNFNTIDFVKGANNDTRFLAINPTGHIPMVEEGQFKILGGNHIIFVYLAKNSGMVGQKLFPTEMEQKIKAVIGWHQAKMMVPGQQMFRMQCMPEQFKLKSAKEQYKRWEQDFMSCLKGLDMKLV